MVLKDLKKEGLINSKHYPALREKQCLQQSKAKLSENQTKGGSAPFLQEKTSLLLNKKLSEF